jgi:hypothetical protein
MRRAAGALLVLAALALAPAALAQRLTLEVTSKVVQAHAHDIAPKGKPNKGDSIDFRDLLLNRTALFGKKRGKAVAYDVGTVTYTSSTATRMDVVATFPGIGTIRYGGPFVSGKDGNTVLTVTGGTGAFAGVTGTVTIGPGATKGANTYVLDVPHKVDVGAHAVA